MKLMDVLQIEFDGPKFVLDNVANYYFHHEKECWRLSDFPLPRPPFNEMWFEYKMPRTCWSKEVGETPMFPMMDESSEIYFGGYVSIAENGFYSLDGKFYLLNKHKPQENMRSSGVNGFSYEIVEGKIQTKIFTNIEGPEEQVSSALYAFHPVLMSFSFCNCRNVEVVHVKAAERIQRARRRRGKPEFQQHRIINILPFGQVFERRDRVVTVQEGTGDKLVIQIRRGSYARYGPEFEKGLLFGKYSGMFWRPAILKDSKREYQIRPEPDTRKEMELKQEQPICAAGKSGHISMSKRESRLRGGGRYKW